MSRSYSMVTVIRQTENRYLRELFDSLGIEHSEIDWESLRQSEYEPILEWCETLPAPQRDELTEIFVKTFELASPEGQAALAEAGESLTDSAWRAFMLDEGA